MDKEPHTLNSTSSRRLGRNGPAVFSIGLGCMAFSGVYGHADENESIATIHAALDRGINLIDTGDFYGMGHNEMLVGRALKGRREKVLISVKFGALRGPDGSWLGYDARPAAVKSFLAHSLNRLDVDYIDVYRPARLDRSVPIEDTIGAITEMIQAGYVRSIGLSEVGVETVRRAHAVHPIADLQIEYSIIQRGPEATIFPVLEELGIAATAYGVLSRGLLTGSKPTSGRDIRNHFPRFAGENLARNQTVIEALKTLAAAKGATPAQLATAWVLAKNRNVIPVMGARTRAQLEDILGALRISLSTADLAAIDSSVSGSPVAGARYAEPQMKQLESEVGC